MKFISTIVALPIIEGEFFFSLLLLNPFLVRAETDEKKSVNFYSIDFFFLFLLLATLLLLLLFMSFFIAWNAWNSLMHWQEREREKSTEMNIECFDFWYFFFSFSFWKRKKWNQIKSSTFFCVFLNSIKKKKKLKKKKFKQKYENQFVWFWNCVGRNIIWFNKNKIFALSMLLYLTLLYFALYTMWFIYYFIWIDFDKVKRKFGTLAKDSGSNIFYTFVYLYKFDTFFFAFYHLLVRAILKINFTYIY